MIRFGKKAAAVAAISVMASMSFTGCSGSIDSDAVVATVGDEEMTLGVANFYARMTQGQYETYLASMMGTTAEEMWAQESGEGSTYEETTKDGIMETLENMYLMSQHAEEYGVTLTDEEREAITAAAEQFDADNADEVKAVVSGYKKDVEKVLELVTIQSKMYDAMREGVDEEVSDEEAAQKSMQYIFFSYTTTDDSGSSVELTDEEKTALQTTAQSVSDRAAAGEDMETLASESELEVQTATFDSESTSPNSDLVAAADALTAEGEVTAPVETDSGIYVAKLTSLLDREATDAEKETIVEQRRTDQYNSLLEEWRDEVEISVSESVWDKVDFTYQGITIITEEEEESDTTTDETTDGTTDGTEDGTADETTDGSTDGTADDGTVDDGSAGDAETDTSAEE